MLPIIDFKPFLTGDADAKTKVAKEMLSASSTFGFFYLKGVGIAAEDIQTAFQASQKFFALPIEEKEALAYENPESNRGYIAVKRETLDPTQQPDLKEAINLGTELTDQNPDHPAKNKWPSSNPEFRETIEPFIRQCTGTALNILRALALALDIDEEFFVNAHNQHDHTFRMLHYPALKRQISEGESRAGAHTDYGSITLLFQDNVGGLEVKNKQGEWVKATPVPGTIVVNTGDLMQRWTNEVFSSNPHRVKQPPESREKDRYSIAYFCTPNPDYMIETIPTCITSDRPQKYDAIKAHAHLLERLSRTY